MHPFLISESFVDTSFMDNDLTSKGINTPQLTCLGKVSLVEDVFHSDGYVCSREFESVLNNRDPSHFLHLDETVLLFDKYFVFEEAFFSDIGVLLKLVKTTYERIEISARGNQVTSTGSTVSVFREKIINFMSYIKIFTHRFLSDFGKDEELVYLYENLKKVVETISSWLGNASEMPGIIFNSGSLMNNSSTVAVLFHTFLDIKWSLLEVALMATNLRKYNEDYRKSRESFREILQQLEESLCEDLLYLAIRRFPEIAPNDWTATTPYTCTCIRELWFMLLTLLKSESSVFNFVLKQYSTLTAYSTSPGTLQLTHFAETKKLKLSSKDPLALVWLLVHLSRLGGFDQTGVWDRNFSRMESSYEVVNKLVQLYLNGTETLVTEDRTRGLMGCLYSLSHTWGSNLNLSIILWEYFHKKLDENFNQSSSFEVLPYTSSLSWYDNLTTGIEPWKVLTTRHNSYFIFLRLLGYHLEMMNAKSQASLKARLYVKLQGKRIQELSLLGLYHMLSACLIIVLASESTDDMIEKILDMSADHKHRSIFFVAQMVLLLICVRHGRNCEKVAASISSQLESVSSGLKDTDLKVREEQRKHGTMFVENFQEVIFHSQNLSSGQIYLIGKSLRSYLKNCGSCDRSVILEALSKMMEKFRSSSANCEELFTAMMTHIYPLMKEKFATIEYINFFVELTAISMDTSGHEFQSLFTFFCLDEKVTPRLSLKYLSRLFETRQFLVNLSLSMDNYQSVLIQSWFRTSFLLPALDELTEDFDRLNSVIKRLPRMAELTVQSKAQINSNEMISQFMLMISANHQNVQSFSDRASVRETYLQYIGPLDKYLNSCFTSGFWEDADQLGHVLRLGGQLYFHCGNIIYTKGKIDCLLAQLNNLLLIPPHLSDLSKEIPAAATPFLQQYLPTYMFGLCRLNPSRDPYVMRCLSTIFQAYMTRFSPNHSHPFTRCWIGLESEPVSSSLVPVMKSWFLQTISASVLPQKVAKTSSHLQPTLQWLKFLITNKEWKSDIFRSLLLPILELSLILDEISGKKSVTDFLQASVCAPDSDHAAIIEQALSELVGRHLAFNSNRLFKLIEVISMLNTDLVRRTLPKIREQVAITETKRGTGADSILRHQLATLELSLEGSRR